MPNPDRNCFQTPTRAQLTRETELANQTYSPKGPKLPWPRRPLCPDSQGTSDPAAGPMTSPRDPSYPSYGRRRKRGVKEGGRGGAGQNAARHGCGARLSGYFFALRGTEAGACVARSPSGPSKCQVDNPGETQKPRELRHPRRGHLLPPAGRRARGSRGVQPSPARPARQPSIDEQTKSHRDRSER